MPLVLKTVATAREAGEALRHAGTRYLGGGTLTVRAANEGDLSFSTLVRATDPALSLITVSEGRATIGASTTMARIAAHPELSVIAPAARAVGGPAVRNMATVGGNLFAASPYGDFTVALVALGATVHLGGENLSIDDFLAGRDTFGAQAIATAVSFAMPESGLRFAKVSRIKPKGISVLSIAAVLDLAADGRVARASIGLGCMADRPMRARAAEKALVGAVLTEEGIAPALAVAGEATAPITDAIGSAWYRSEVLPVHLGRLLLR